MSSGDRSRHLPHPARREKDAGLGPKEARLQTPARAKCSRARNTNRTAEPRWPGGSPPACVIDDAPLTRSPAARGRRGAKPSPTRPRSPGAATKPTPPLHARAGSCPRPRPEDIRGRSRMRVGTGAFSVPDFRPRPLHPARGISAQTRGLNCLHTWVWG